MIIYKENSKIYFYSNYKRWESVAMLLKLEWLSFINWSGWPISSSFPFLKTAIRSESIIVFNLWAMVKTVQSANSFRRVDCIKSSVSWSTVAVASSRTKTKSQLSLSNWEFWATFRDHLHRPGHLLEYLPRDFSSGLIQGFSKVLGHCDHQLGQD